MSSIKYFIEKNTGRLDMDEFLARELNSAGYGGVEIRKMPMRTELVIHSSRPGVVIGRRGSNIRELTYTLENEFGIENIQIEVQEIENPWLNAQVMASRIARQLERGVRYRRMSYWILRRIMRAGAVGCEIVVKGKLSSRRARYQKFKAGTIAKTGEPSNVFVDEADDHAVLKPGVIGIKVRIMGPAVNLPGYVNIPEPEVMPSRETPVLIEEEAQDEAEEAEEEEVEEGLEGITDLDELKELEELDGLELVDDREEGPQEKDVEETEEEEPQEEEESEIDVESTMEELEELDNLDESEEGGD